MRWNGASRFEFDGNSMETEATTWSEFLDGGKAIVEQILASEEINKSVPGSSAKKDVNKK